MKFLKRFSSALLSSALVVAPAHAAFVNGVVYDGSAAGVVFAVAPGCTAGPTAFNGSTWYISPTGSDSNPGTFGSPFQHISKAFSVYNPAGGDTIALFAGTYPAVTMLGLQNTVWARIIPVPGQTAVVTSFDLEGAKKWVIQGLTVQSLQNGNLPLVNISGEATHGQSSDIIFDSNIVQSADDAVRITWDATGYTNNARETGIQILGGDINSTYEHCTAITNNTVKNIKFGMGLTGDYILASYNAVSFTSNDQLDYAGNKIYITHELHTNSLYANSGLHNDGFQGQCGYAFCGNGIGLGGIYDTLVLDSNVFIDRTLPKTDPAMALFTDGPDGTQGMGNFDADWTNVTVINNIVVGTATQLLSFSSIHAGSICNNTVFNTGLNGSADLSGGLNLVSLSHNGNPSDHVNLCNNLVANLGDDDMGGGATQGNVTFNNNLVTRRIDWWAAPAGSPSFNSAPGTYGTANAITATSPFTGIYQSINITTGTYDFHLLGGSPGLGFGALPAPACMNGSARGVTPNPNPPNAGAYC